MTVSAHFVTFCSPGTIVPETNEMPIGSWDIEEAKAMACTITQRHNATPFGFFFTTRSRDDADLDSRQTAKSNFYYLGGRVETREEVEARNDPIESILRDNMRRNGYDKIIVNTNSWRFTSFLRDTDVILDFTPPAREQVA